jgi:3-oxoacyl-[acyl-carrier protein] reductase
MKLIVVTGSSRGLGKKIAQHYLAEGFVVAGCSRGDSSIVHEHYFHQSLDLASEKDVRSWVRQLRKGEYQIEGLICSAGMVRAALFLSITPDDVMDAFIQNNFVGVFHVMREVSKLMAANRYGRIIAITSTLVSLHEEGSSIYSATKAAVTEMTKILAKELASSGVTCNIVAPGLMDTGPSRELSKSGDWKQRMLEKQTIERVIELDEVCHACDFFISPKASSITGQTIHLGLVT